MRVFAVSPEPAAAIARFADRHGVAFPLLSDADSAVIRRFGILNAGVPADHPRHGIPHPGAYLTDAGGRVAQKHFDGDYRVRDSAATVLSGGVGAWIDPAAYPSARGGAAVSATLAGRVLRPHRRAHLLVRIALPAGRHAYGEPVPAGLVAARVTVEGPPELEAGEPLAPPTRPFRVEGVAEPLHVFDGEAVFRVPLVYRRRGVREGDRVPIVIEARWQECDERACYLPSRERLALGVPAGPLPAPDPE